LVNSYRNTISKWAVVVRYENFFIPRVKKSSKISPWEKNLASRGPTALGRTRFFALGLICEDFSTLGMKKFPYLKIGPFGNPIFTYGKYLKLRPFFSGFLVHLCMGVRWKFCPSDSISNKHNENWQAVLSLDKKIAKEHNFHRTISWQCTGKLEENQIVLS